MDKEEKLQSILKAVELEVKQWLEEEPIIKDPILYEGRLLDLSFRFGRNLIENGSGILPKDRNAKKKS